MKGVGCLGQVIGILYLRPAQNLIMHRTRLGHGSKPALPKHMKLFFRREAGRRVGAIIRRGLVVVHVSADFLLISYCRGCRFSHANYAVKKTRDELVAVAVGLHFTF